ncbi:hypothetical protein D030_1498B, partial [Vibrio parahaemolyticus AQ3810]
GTVFSKTSPGVLPQTTTFNRFDIVYDLVL